VPLKRSALQLGSGNVGAFSFLVADIDHQGLTG
jgi:hypothetical protein